MITEALKVLAVEEANNLKLHATREELQRLHITTLVPQRQDLCIYGMMTGNCLSVRALTLLKLCTQPYSGSISGLILTYGYCSFNERNRPILGPYCMVFSPIEFYINQPYAKNPELIAYLKGETETLEL